MPLRRCCGSRRWQPPVSAALRAASAPPAPQKSAPDSTCLRPPHLVALLLDSLLQVLLQALQLRWRRDQRIQLALQAGSFGIVLRLHRQLELQFYLLHLCAGVVPRGAGGTEPSVPSTPANPGGRGRPATPGCATAMSAANRWHRMTREHAYVLLHSPRCREARKVGAGGCRRSKARRVALLRDGGNLSKELLE